MNMNSQNNTPDNMRKTAMMVACTALVMVGMSFAAVPAYRAFCQVTGWGGTTGRADAAPQAAIDRKITIRFDASYNGDLPWDFKPEQVSQTIKVGASGLAFYEAENLADKAVSGRATYNVSPAKAGKYFKKVDCFCFTEQRLSAGQKVSMPVSYFIDPAIAKDRNMDEVETITLSYTFFRWDDEDDNDRLAAAE